jgi:hypothetical protein
LKTGLFFKEMKILSPAFFFAGGDWGRLFDASA